MTTKGMYVYVITAPTSTIGRLVVDDLLARGEKPRLVTRDASRLAPGVREGAEIVEGSHGDEAVVERACADAEAVFWLAPDDGDAPGTDAAYVDFMRSLNSEPVRARGWRRGWSTCSRRRTGAWTTPSRAPPGRRRRRRSGSGARRSSGRP
ncbi:NAD(P)H-binding protein [Streptomyces sp. NPDC058683]|uniref:NAD(P)H-binding protein n=1 Tax=Streptomyces sp. NPDC058683 TaxID=3346597 RepID=UPI00366016DC